MNRGMKSAGGWKQVVVAGSVFVLASAGMGAMEWRRSERLAAAVNADYLTSENEIRQKIEADRLAAAAKSGEPTAAEDPWPSGLKARWQIGPDKAQVRVVILSSYQCPDCKRIEEDAFQLMEKYKGKMSLGAMHFPLCPDCNKHVKSQNPHPNSCWAARAAETAGILGGPDGFWKMHKWLFEKKGSFTQEELTAALPGLGLDKDVFYPIMTKEAAVRPVEQDIEVGEKMGLYFTPMVFVNGVELRGWQTPGALPRAVDAVMAGNPPELTAVVDKPPLAAQKYLDDWKFAPRLTISASRDERSLGSADAIVQVVVFGDYTEPNTEKVNDILAGWMASGDKPVRYSYRHFPGDQACNPSLPKTFFPNGCMTAKAAEAAGTVGGADAFWRMHAWLFQQKDKDNLTLDQVKKGAASLGLDAAKFATAMNAPEVDAAVKSDIMAARAIGAGQIPAIYVNGRFVQRWARDNDDVMGRILAEAIAETKQSETKPSEKK